MARRIGEPAEEGGEDGEKQHTEDGYTEQIEGDEDADLMVEDQPAGEDEDEDAEEEEQQEEEEEEEQEEEEEEDEEEQDKEEQDEEEYEGRAEDAHGSDGLDGTGPHRYTDSDLKRSWKEAFDLQTGKPLPYHHLYDQADAKIMSSKNTMLVHLRIGPTIPTRPGMPRHMRIRVPVLCPVSVLKRLMCRGARGALYPSFLRLSWPDSGEVLEEYDGGGQERRGRVSGWREERTLASYGVVHNSTLQLDLQTGDLFEALRVHDGGNPLVLAVREQQPAAAPAAAGGAAGLPGTASAAAAAAAPCPMPGRATVVAAPKRKRYYVRRDEYRGYTVWSMEETMALLDGVAKYEMSGAAVWREIKSDPEFADALRDRTLNDMTSRWGVMKKAEKRGFGVSKGMLREPDLQDRIREVMAVAG